MPRYESMRDRLPSLYRPDPDDDGLLPQFVKAIASVLDEVNALSGEVMQAHWFDHADSALYSSFLLQSRVLDGKLPLSPLKAEDRKLLDEFPYIHDLAWLADLIPLPPWQEPPAYRESVEAYRARIRRMVELFKNGLGTPSAFRRVVEAQFPINMDLSADQRDRPFTVEEFAPLVYRLQQVKMAPGVELEDMAGPLMTWKILNDGLETGPPTLYIQGVAAVPDKVDETAKPLVERVTPLSNGALLAIGFDDTIPPDKTLRLSPGYRSWLGMAKGVQLAESLPDDNGPGNPTADGPWSKAKGGPADPVSAFLVTPDNILWVGNNAATGELHRFDGTNWTVALTGLDPVNCL